MSKTTYESLDNKIAASTLTKDLTKGLEAMGYLETKPLGEEKSYKCPTEKGLQRGIIAEKKVNAYGNEYCVNLYNKKAQRFVMENLEEILRGVIR